MIIRLTFISCLFLAFAIFAGAAESIKTFDTDSYTDIFISSQKADITVTADDGKNSSITWRPKLCSMVFSRPSKDVVEIVIRPEKQNSLFKKILMIPRSRCSIKLKAGENKNIYTSSETGDIRFFAIKSKKARAYSGQGVVETSDIKGNFTAETLTDRINIRAFDGQNLSLKTASGNILVTGRAKDISLLNTSGNTKMYGSAESLMFYSSQGSLNAKWDELPKKELTISAHSFSGDIKIYLPKFISEEQEQNSKIDIKTFYGSAFLETR